MDIPLNPVAFLIAWMGHGNVVENVSSSDETPRQVDQSII